MCDCVDFAIAGTAVLSIKNLSNFKLSLRAEVRRYWNGVINKSDFIFEFHNAIDRGFNRAFNIGVSECGKKRGDLNAGDIDQIQGRINAQFPFVANLADEIVQKKDGGKFGKQAARLSSWYPRFGEMVQLGKAVACGNENLEWVIGVAEHCASCLKLNGIVKPASFWIERNILPRVPNASYLICKGFECKCELKPTKKPVSKGRLPSLP